MQKSRKEFFTGRQKNTLLALLACTTVFSLVLHVSARPSSGTYSLSSKSFGLGSMQASADGGFCESLFESVEKALDNEDLEKANAFADWYFAFDCLYSFDNQYGQPLAE